MPGSWPDPFGHFRFLVGIEGIGWGSFLEVLLPEARTEVIEYRTGNDRGAVRKFPDWVRFSNLVLGRILVPARDLFDWWQGAAFGPWQRRTILVLLLDPGGVPVQRWRLHASWPVAYRIAPFRAVGGSQTLVEILEVAVEGMSLDY